MNNNRPTNNNKKRRGGKNKKYEDDSDYSDNSSDGAASDVAVSVPSRPQRRKRTNKGQDRPKLDLFATAKKPKNSSSTKSGTRQSSNKSSANKTRSSSSKKKKRSLRGLSSTAGSVVQHDTMGSNLLPNDPSVPPLPPVAADDLDAKKPSAASACQSTAAGTIPSVAADNLDVKMPSNVSAEPSPFFIDDLMKFNLKEGATEKIDIANERDVMYNVVKAGGRQNWTHRGEGAPYDQFMNRISTKLLGEDRDKWYFHTLNIVQDYRQNGIRFLCWDTDLNGHYDLGDKRVITLSMNSVKVMQERGHGDEDDEDDEDDEGVAETRMNDYNGDIDYGIDDAGNALDSNGNYFYLSGDMSQVRPSQEEVIEHNVDNNGNDCEATKMLALMAKHVEETPFENMTQHSQTLGLTPADGEEASAQRTFELLTEDGALDKYAAKLHMHDAKYSVLFNKGKGGAEKEYRAMLEFSLAEQTWHAHSRKSARSLSHLQACSNELKTNLQRLIENSKEQKGGKSSRFLSGHVYRHLPNNSMRGTLPGDEPIEIQASELMYVRNETIIYPHSSESDRLQHLVAPDRVGSVMPLCLTGTGYKDGRNRFGVYDRTACETSGFVVGYACTRCNPESIRKMFIQKNATSMKYDDNIAAHGNMFPNKGAISTDKNGRPAVGLVGAHSWITTGYCSCDGQFYCYDCFPKHVEDKWNEDNPPERNVNVMSSHDYQLLPSAEGTKTSCAGCETYFKLGRKKCSCQIGRGRYCEGCYSEHCIDCLKQAIDNLPEERVESAAAAPAAAAAAAAPAAAEV